MKETDLSTPICNYFEDEGYEIRCEVNDCDIVAKKDDKLIIIELKMRFGLNVLYQAVERQKISNNVYIAIPRPKSQKAKAFRNCVALLKRLDIGLIVVSLDSSLKVATPLFHPTELRKITSTRKKNLLVKEFDNRSMNLNCGGMTKKAIVTAYRETSIAIATILFYNETATTAELKKLGFENCSGIIGKNFYGWFLRIEKGCYALSEKGFTELNQYEVLVKHYKDKFNL